MTTYNRYNRPPNRENASISTLGQAFELMPEEETGGPTTEGRVGRPDALPSIIDSDRQMRDIRIEAIEALTMQNEPPVIFNHGGHLARLDGTYDSMRVAWLTPTGMRGRLTEVADWFSYSADGTVKAIRPPMDIATDVLARGCWPFPVLLGITHVPIVRPDGTICTQPGYDPASQLVYAPAAGLIIPPIPTAPTPSDIRAAAALIDELFCDFPFDSKASRAAAWAALLTPILRPVIPGPTPLFLFDKPKQGTGASLLADCIGIVVIGRDPAKTTAPSSEEEWRKKITSILIAGVPLSIFDNVDQPLASGHLSSVLTDVEWSDRKLGQSAMVRLRVQTTWLATGNNIRVRGDVARRIIWLRMDAGLARPWERRTEDFRHPQLREWVHEQRGAILAAILTLVRAWFAAGQPAPAGHTLGAYEIWSRITAGVLEQAGVAGFLENLHQLYEQADDESAAWTRFLGALSDRYAGGIFTVAELARDVFTKQELRAALPDDLADNTHGNLQRRLGHALASRADTRYSRYRVVRAGERQHAVVWRVIAE